MNYYSEWKKIKKLLSLVPMIVFWLASMVFFVVGMSFDNPMIIFRRDVSMAIAVGLALSITAIQVIGNDNDDMDSTTRVIWIASYVLGIGTNIYGLSIVLSISNPLLEWVVCTSLGVMIEVSPEKFFVQFLRGLKSVEKKSGGQQPIQNRPRPQQPSPKPIPANQIRRPQQPPVPQVSPQMRGNPVYHPIGFQQEKADQFQKFMKGLEDA